MVLNDPFQSASIQILPVYPVIVYIRDAAQDKKRNRLQNLLDDCNIKSTGGIPTLIQNVKPIQIRLCLRRLLIPFNKAMQQFLHLASVRQFLQIVLILKQHPSFPIIEVFLCKEFRQSVICFFRRAGRDIHIVHPASSQKGNSVQVFHQSIRTEESIAVLLQRHHTEAGIDNAERKIDVVHDEHIFLIQRIRLSMHIVFKYFTVHCVPPLCNQEDANAKKR